jgi:hypothetical protein
MSIYQVTATGPNGVVDLTPNVLSANWSRSLGESSATLDLSCKNIATNHCMDAITLSVNGTLWFSGTIKTQSESFDQTMKRVEMKCIDNTDRLQRLLVAEVFENQTAKEIITEARNKYAPWLGITNVDDVGGEIEQLTFNYESFASLIDKLSEITGAHWNIDGLNRLSFFLENDGFASTDYTPARILDGSFSLDVNALDLCNRIWIIGARQASQQTIEQTFIGDGNNQYFSFAYVPNYPKVRENGVLKTIAVDKEGTPTTNYVYNKKEKVLKRVAGNLPSGVTLKVEYNPTVQVIDYFEDPASVAAYGLYEKAVIDKKITDKMAARKRGRAELKRKKDIIRSASWNTRHWRVNPGQLTKVTLPVMNVNSYWRIESVNVNFTPDDIIADISAEEVDQ